MSGNEGLIRRPRRTSREESQPGEWVASALHTRTRMRPTQQIQMSQVDVFIGSVIVACTVMTVLKGVAEEQRGSPLPPSCWNAMTIVCGSMVWFYTLKEPLVSILLVVDFFLVVATRIGLAEQDCTVGRHMLTMMLFLTTLVYMSSTAGQNNRIVYVSLGASLVSICVDLVTLRYALDVHVHVVVVCSTALLAWLRSHGGIQSGKSSCPGRGNRLTELGLTAIGFLGSAMFGNSAGREQTGGTDDLLEPALKRLSSGDPVYLDIKTLSFTDKSVQEVFDQFVVKRVHMASGLSTMLLASVMAINAGVMVWYASQSRHWAWAAGVALYWASLACVVALQNGLSVIVGVSWSSTCIGSVVPAVILAGIMEPGFSSVMLLYILYFDLWTSLYNVDLCRIQNALSNTLLQLVVCVFFKLLTLALGHQFELKILYFMVLLAVGRVLMLAVLRYRLVKKFLGKMKCTVEDDYRVTPLSEGSDPWFQSGWWIDMLTMEFQDSETEKDYRNYAVIVSENMRAFCLVAGAVRILVEQIIIVTSNSIDNVTRVVFYGVLSLVQMGCVAQKYGFLKSQYAAVSVALIAVVYDSFRLVSCSDTKEFGNQIYLIDGVVIIAPTLMYWEWTWLAQIGIGYVLLMVKVIFSSGRASDMLSGTILGIAHTLVALAAGLAGELDRRKNFHRMYTLSDRVWNMLRFEKFGTGTEESKNQMSEIARRVSVAIETPAPAPAKGNRTQSTKSDVSVELPNLLKARIASVNELFEPLKRSQQTSFQLLQEDLSDDEADVITTGCEGLCLFPLENELGEMQDFADGDSENPLPDTGTDVITNPEGARNIDQINIFGCGGQTDEPPSTDDVQGTSEAAPISISLSKLVPAEDKDSPFIFDLAKGASLLQDTYMPMGISQRSPMNEDPAFASGARNPLGISVMSSMPEDPAFASMGNDMLAPQLDNSMRAGLLQMISPPQDPAFASVTGGNIGPLSQPSMPSLPPNALIPANDEDSHFIFNIAQDESKAEDHVFPTCVGFQIREDTRSPPEGNGQIESHPTPSTAMNTMSDMNQYSAYVSPIHSAGTPPWSEPGTSDRDPTGSAYIFDFSYPDRCELDKPPRVLYNDISEMTIISGQASTSPPDHRVMTTLPTESANSVNSLQESPKADGLPEGPHTRGEQI